jgi:hypothetical protein
MENNSEKEIKRGLDAAFKIISDAKTRNQLLDEKQAEKVMLELKLPQSTSLRSKLLLISSRIDHIKEHAVSKNIEDKDSEAEEMRKMLLESFVHIRWSFWMSLIMSVTLFVVGIIFLSTAVMQSLTESSASTTTFTIAGLGIADFVLLFYTRPWQDISANLANSQQIKIIATSYLAGLSLLPEEKTEALKSLEQLTTETVTLIEDIKKNKASNSKTAKATNQAKK